MLCACYYNLNIINLQKAGVTISPSRILRVGYEQEIRRVKETFVDEGQLRILPPIFALHGNSLTVYLTDGQTD